MDDYLRSINLDLSDSILAAPALLGYKLIVSTPDGETSGYIVETEAYHTNDPASHSFIGITKRNRSLFEAPGTVYVYFTYGMHYCVNIVTGPKDQGQAVLIRAIEPISGFDLMAKRRVISKLSSLTNGPAKLTQAMAINKSFDGSSILNGPLRIETGFKPKVITAAPRIGISKAKDYEWRFYIEGNRFVSRSISSKILS
jgi:DNA-3-methyladenine glycosylase